MNEYISREAAKKAVCERCDYAGTRECVSCDNPAEAIPAADVKPVVHGRWIWDENGMDWGIGAWLCSECEVRPETWWATEATINPLRCSGSHYCGHCGADMREGDGE